MLGNIFEKFIAKAPVAVMVRGVLERVLNPDVLNDIYARAAVTPGQSHKRWLIY